MRVITGQATKREEMMTIRTMVDAKWLFFYDCVAFGDYNHLLVNYVLFTWQTDRLCIYNNILNETCFELRVLDLYPNI